MSCLSFEIVEEPLTPGESQQGQFGADDNDCITRDFYIPQNRYNTMETYSIRFLKICEDCGISSNAHRTIVDFFNEVLQDEDL